MVVPLLKHSDDEPSYVGHQRRQQKLATMETKVFLNQSLRLWHRFDESLDEVGLCDWHFRS